jgi:hypothetical protein
MKTAAADASQAELMERIGFAVGSSGGSNSHFLLRKTDPAHATP